MKIILEATIDEIKVEDSGQALIARIGDDDSNIDPHFFVQLQSYDEASMTGMDGHWTMNRLRGKRVRVTVEVIEPITS